MMPRVTTWYAQGQREPWRLTIDVFPVRVESRSFETFAGMIEALAHEWATAMPEPLDAEPGASA